MIGTLVRILLIWSTLLFGTVALLQIGQPTRPAQIPHSGVDIQQTTGILSAAGSTTTTGRHHGIR